MKIKKIILSSLFLSTLFTTYTTISHNSESQLNLDATQSFVGGVSGIENDETLRIWFSPGAFWQSAQALYKVVWTDNFKNESWQFFNFQQSNKLYVYFDVPTNVIGKNIFFERWAPNNSTRWNYTGSVLYQTGHNSQIFYNADDWWDTFIPTRGIIGGNVDANIAAAALAGYLSCSSSLDNGYGKFDNFNLTFVKNSNNTFKTVGDLDKIIFYDYDGIGSSSYGSPRGTTKTVDAYTKYLQLEIGFNSL